MQIQKRDGTYQDFDREKIINAILKAFKEIDGDVIDYAITKSKKIADFIENKAKDAVMSIDEIQEMLENGLMSTKRRDVARAYIEYRHDRDQVRRWKNDMMAAMEQKLNGSNIENSNANMDENSFGGRKGEATNIMLKQYALDNCMSKKSKNLHLSNHIYIHDLDNYALGTHNCLTLPVDKLLAEGFNTRQTDIRPANSVNTAFQLLAVLFQLQSLMQFGGVSASHLDWTMVPYVRKSFWKYMKNGRKYIYKVPNEYNTQPAYTEHLQEVIDWIAESAKNNDPIEKGKQIDCKRLYDYALDMTKREIQQAVEGMYHNLNTLQSRSGNQLPFSSINFGTCTEPEGRMIIKALLEGSLKGVGKLHKTPIFPKL